VKGHCLVRRIPSDFVIKPTKEIFAFFYKKTLPVGRANMRVRGENFGHSRGVFSAKSL
jgi:hypothetical protein